MQRRISYIADGRAVRRWLGPGTGNLAAGQGSATTAHQAQLEMEMGLREEVHDCQRGRAAGQEAEATVYGSARFVALGHVDAADDAPEARSGAATASARATAAASTATGATTRTEATLAAASFAAGSPSPAAHNARAERAGNYQRGAAGPATVAATAAAPTAVASSRNL